MWAGMLYMLVCFYMMVNKKYHCLWYDTSALLKYCGLTLLMEMVLVVIIALAILTNEREITESNKGLQTLSKARIPLDEEDQIHMALREREKLDRQDKFMEWMHGKMKKIMHLLMIVRDVMRIVQFMFFFVEFVTQPWIGYATQGRVRRKKAGLVDIKEEIEDDYMLNYVIAVQMMAHVMIARRPTTSSILEAQTLK
ncbi:hypothetical protein ACJX0J_005883 [Zea mays]